MALAAAPAPVHSKRRKVVSIALAVQGKQGQRKEKPENGFHTLERKIFSPAIAVDNLGRGAVGWQLRVQLVQPPVGFQFLYCYEKSGTQHAIDSSRSHQRCNLLKSTSNNRSAPYPAAPRPSSPPQQPAQANVAVPLKSTLWAAHLVEKHRLQMVRLQVLQRYFVCLITGGGLGTLGGGGGE